LAQRVASRARAAGEALGGVVLLLHPLVTVGAVAAGVAVGGLLGAILAVPLVAIAVGFGGHYRSKGEASPAGPAPADDAADAESRVATDCATGG